MKKRFAEFWIFLSKITQNSSENSEELVANQVVTEEEESQKCLRVT